MVLAVSVSSGTEWSVRVRIEVLVSSRTRPSLIIGTARKPTSATNAMAAIRPATSLTDISGPFHCSTATSMAATPKPTLCHARTPRPRHEPLRGVRERRRSENQCPGSAGVVLDDELDLAGHRDLGPLGPTNQLRMQLLEADLQVLRQLRQDVAVGAGGGDLERRHRLALRLIWIVCPGFTSNEGRST